MHTPGPWHAMVVGTHWMALEQPPAPGRHIAMMTELHEAEANARLIASAPDLLEALEWYVANDDTIEMSDNGYWLDGMKRAQAAIKKARGDAD